MHGYFDLINYASTLTHYGNNYLVVATLFYNNSASSGNFVAVKIYFVVFIVVKQYV